jgi:8-oxo-dGTP pyrophosphatase MutT (NUDIX family)
MSSCLSIPQMEAFAFASPAPVRVVVSAQEPPANSAAIDAAWAKLLAANPRYFDGPMLSVLHIDRETCTIHTRRDRFSRLAVQPPLNTGVRICSVTAVLTARDGAGSLHVLLGKRSPQTRIYADMWELGPSGGLSVPPPALSELDQAAIFSHLQDEVSEEVGLHIATGTAWGITRDDIAKSDDIVFICDCGDLLAARAHTSAANWEYTAVQWLATRDVADFDAKHAEAIIGPTRALFRALEWIDSAD